MSLENRKTVRERMATEMIAVYGTNIEAFYPYMATAFEGLSPVVRLYNGGSMRQRRAGYAPAADSAMRYIVQHFVRFDEAGSAAEQQAAEDTLDGLELLLMTFMSDQDQIPGVWKQIRMVDYSEPVLTKTSAYQYLLEAFILEAVVDG